jgi:hypothetical protein
VVAAAPAEPHVERAGRRLAGAHAGTPLQAGDRIYSGPSGRVDIGIAGKAVIRVEKRGDAILSDSPLPQGAPDQGATVRLRLISGAVLIRASGLGASGCVTVEAAGRIVTSRYGAWAVKREGDEVRATVAEGRVSAALAAAPDAVTDIGPNMTLVSSGADNLPSETQAVGADDEPIVSELQDLVIPSAAYAQTRTQTAHSAAPASEQTHQQTSATHAVDLILMVKKSLKLAADQEEGVMRIYRRYDDSLRGLAGMPAKAVRTSLDNLTREFDDAFVALLTPAQQARFPRLMDAAEMLGTVGLPPQAAGVLDLSAKQRALLDTIGAPIRQWFASEEDRLRSGHAMTGAEAHSEMKALAKLRLQAMRKAMAALTPAQRALVKSCIPEKERESWEQQLR